MAGVTLPDIQGWSAQHLDEHSAHWLDLAERRVEVVGRIRDDASGLDFTGAGQKGMMDAVAQHHATATAQADELTSAAQTARRYAEQLGRQQRTILGVVQQARQQGFEVSPTWQVTDVQSRTATEAMVRQPAAQAIAAQLGQHVATFVGTETAAGADLSAHAGKLGGASMVDFKTDGGGVDSQKCHDAMQQKESDKERSLFVKFIEGAILGGVAGAETGPGALLTALGGGAGNVIIGGIDEATTPHPLPPECK